MIQLWHHISSLSLLNSFSHSLRVLVSCQCIFYEALCWRGDISASTGSLSPPPFWVQRAASTCSQRAGLLPPARSEHLRDLQRHLHPAHAEPPAPTEDQRPAENIISGNHRCIQPNSGAVYQLQSPGSAAPFSHNHPLHPGAHRAAAASQTLPLSAAPAAVPPPHYHTHMRMSASPC